VRSLKNLLDKLIVSGNCIHDFDKSVKEDEAEANRLPTLKSEEKRLNDELKKQNKEINEMKAEKLRFKMDYEEKARKDKDRLNKMRAEYELK